MENSDTYHEEEQNENLLRFLKDRGDPFEAPEGYFDLSSKNLLEKIEDEEILADHTRLEIKESETFFLTPSTYFEEFPEKILRIISNKSTAIVSFRHLWYPLAVAASIALLISLGWMQSPSQSPNSTAYISEALADFSEAEMLALLERENLDATVLLEMAEEVQLSPELLFEESVEEAEIDAFLDEMDVSELESFLFE